MKVAMRQAILMVTCLCGVARAETCIVKDGQPQADIVIAEQPARMARLAAEELQTYVEKVTGARLTITNAPGPGAAAHVYVGTSPYTERLKVNDEGLKSGAFRMVSGENWLALVGHDSDFAPQGPFHAGGAMASNSPALLEWDRRTGKTWGYPNGMLAREYNAELGIWEQDERGSFNAVTEFLRMQGVRWYLPGELGEIVPKTTTIALPQVNMTVRPDFRLRHPYQYVHMFGHTTREEVMWQLRLGIYNGPDPVVGGAHGQRNVLCRPEMKKAHPEYYALRDGKRDVKSRQACLSSEGMFQETVDYARAMFDIYGATVVSVMPEDGFVSMCQCDLCKGKDSPQRDWAGQLSDYVWDFVNRVAKEVYKTHPDRKVTCAAYGAYLLPPEKIDRLSPNVVVGICQWRSDFQDPKARANFVALRESWLKKLPPGSQFVIADYYLHGRPNMPWDGNPVFFPRLIAQDLQSLKGISIGEFIETYRDAGNSLRSLAALHLNLYVTSRLWWDANQDVDAMLEEYYTLFYGPARDEMKAFIEYSEANWMNLRKSVEKIDQVFALMDKAQRKVAADSVYGKRIALLADFIQPLKALREKVAQGRKNTPKVRGATRDAKDLRLDGKLDDAFWAGLPSYDLKDMKTGQPPVQPSSFKVAWANDSLYFGIECTDADMQNLKIATTRNEDPSIWLGDGVEILLETQSHSYYQVAINPGGAMMDLDRIRGTDSLWASGAEAAVHKADGAWSVEVRIPVVGEQQEAIDPLHGISGKKPAADAPWFFNVCRLRVRDSGNEGSAFSPTGFNFHNVMKFAELTIP